MGIYRRFVDQAQGMNAQPEREPSSRIITSPTLMSASRPVIAVQAGRKLIRGEKGVSPLVAVMAATDAEGNLARLLDKLFPDLGIGVSEIGKDVDHGADAAAIMIVAGAALKAPRVSKTGKAAIGLVLGQEVSKTVWFAEKQMEYRELTAGDEHPQGEMLTFDIGNDGKEAMIEKFMAVLLATATNDVDSPIARHTLGLAAMGHAVAGAARGEGARRDYASQFEEMTAGPTATL